MGEIGNPNDANDYAEREKNDVWTDSIEQYLIALMVEEVKKGNRTSSTFSKSGWKAIEYGIMAKVGKVYSPLQLKNKYNSLRSRQRNFKALLKEPGISYDYNTGIITASDECWRDIFEVHKMAKRFRRKGCKEYEDLCFIFADAHPLTASPPEIEGEDKGESEGGGDVDNGNFRPNSSHIVVATNKSKNKPLVEVPNSKKIRRSHSSVMQKDDFTVVMECLRVLDDLGIHGNAYGKAVKAFHDSPLYRVMFLAMHDERKIDWHVRQTSSRRYQWEKETLEVAFHAQ
ncbi:hypothetical protein Droror1_Dr00005885 [Drosera rotundifolia]